MRKNLLMKVVIATASTMLFSLAVFSIVQISLAKSASNKVVNDNTDAKQQLSELGKTTVMSEKPEGSFSPKNNQQLLDQIPFNEVKSGSLYFKNEHGYYSQLSQNSDYRVEVNGLLARVYFTQTFTNDSDEFLEAVYVFPLSEDTAVDAMVMEIGERRVLGSIKEKKQAKKLYQQARKQGKKASLVTQQRPNMFTTKVANIAPHETIKISLSYLQAVNFNHDEFSLKLPLTITPRYIPQPVVNQQMAELPFENHAVIKLNQTHGWAINNTRVPDANEITPPQTRHSKGQKASIAVKLNSDLALVNIKSSYHRIHQNQVSSKKANTSLAGKQSVVVTLANAKVSLEQDFELHWQLANGESPKAAFFNDIDASDHYGLLMLMPPKGTLGQVLAKEVIYIIDVSGSMGGVAIKQAKLALSQAIDLLADQDSFNIIAFNDQTRPIFNSSQTVNDHTRYQAKQWIGQLQAGGGTDMLPALDLALTSQSHVEKAKLTHTKLKQVIFITDGAVGNETELFNVIEEKLGKTRLHTVGIGSAPNGYFMRQAAESGRGSYRYIGKINEVQQQMQQLFDDISRPMMTEIHIDWPSEQVEIFPQDIPDLYAGQPLVVSVKWKNLTESSHQLPTVINVSGKLANKSWQQSLEINSVAKNEQMGQRNSSQKFNGISTWWGRQKIKHLNNQYRRSSGNQQVKLKEQITNLALKHSLLSKFTSFVAIEEKISRPSDKQLNSQAIANLMPKGSNQAIPLANTALGLTGYLYLGTLMLIIALFLSLLSLPQWLLKLRMNKQEIAKQSRQPNDKNSCLLLVHKK